MKQNEENSLKAQKLTQEELENVNGGGGPGPGGRGKRKFEP
ncbi:MAG: class IIb bacteriocin, lactobin A/cerein 7B family [Prevotella sp.]|nr:class IIb bacteriocin, lactobin A/cerein 7B family [Prevotella sp.]